MAVVLVVGGVLWGEIGVLAADELQKTITMKVSGILAGSDTVADPGTPSIRTPLVIFGLVNNTEKSVVIPSSATVTKWNETGPKMMDCGKLAALAKSNVNQVLMIHSPTGIQCNENSNVCAPMPHWIANPPGGVAFSRPTESLVLDTLPEITSTICALCDSTNQSCERNFRTIFDAIDIVAKPQNYTSPGGPSAPGTSAP